MKFPTLSTLNVKNKTVILRVDINSPTKKGKILNNPRFPASLKTINELKKKKAKVVIIAHQSRPGKSDFISLKQHAKFLKVKFIPSIIDKKAVSAIKNLKPGEAILLENIRFHKDELNPNKNNKLLKTLVSLSDIYINDAFSVSHRKQTSITEFPKFLPSAIGRQMETELKNLEKIKAKNCLYILAGAKPTDLLPLLKNKNILAAGYLGQLILISRGHNLGKQNKILVRELKLKSKLKKLRHITTPVDYAFNIKGKRKELSLKQLPVNYEIMDLGEQTIKLFTKKIKQAKFIFMKGTAGYCEDKKFCKGTFAILRAIAQSKAHSVLGGGHLTTALDKSGINKNKFSHISLSGGALVKYIAGEKLPGLEALRKNKKRNKW